MVSDPNNTTDGTNVSDKDTSIAFAGFSSAAAPKPAADGDHGTTAESDSQKSWRSQFADHMREWRANMTGTTRANKQTSYAVGDNSNDKTWFSTNLGHQVCDCGNSIHLSATRNRPVTKKQIECMVKAAVERKGWDTIYMFQDGNRGKPDIETARNVQAVIHEMRATGKIPADCKISCCTDPALYPKNAGEFDKLFKQFLKAVDPTAEAPAERPGFKTRERPGFHIAPA